MFSLRDDSGLSHFRIIPLPNQSPSLIYFYIYAPLKLVKNNMMCTHRHYRVSPQSYSPHSPKRQPLMKGIPPSLLLFY